MLVMSRDRNIWSRTSRVIITGVISHVTLRGDCVTTECDHVTRDVCMGRSVDDLPNKNILSDFCSILYLEK